MIHVCEPWLHTRLNTVYACIHLDLALPPGHVPATALHLKEKAQHAGYKAPVEKVGHRLGQLRRVGRRARPGRLERGRRAARREGARAAERRGAAGAQDTEGEG